MSTVLAMGGYAAYVWPSYGLAALILGGLAYTSWRRVRAAAARLESLRQAAPHRRRRQEGSDGAE